ncbi:MAG TPA: amino acid adenylation domain-containing protein, partial [Chitinophagaceae bacterium]|nr:amino acid adenylation domain-containing protein [Chitinophagaceae bacterium]
MEYNTLKQYNNLAFMLKERARGNAGITFIKKSNEEDFLSYSQLYDAAVKGLHFLQHKGMRAQDELVFQVDDNRSFIITFWACILGGIIPVPLSIGKNDDHRQKLFNVWPVLNNPFLVIAQEHLHALNAFAGSKGAAMLNRVIEVEGVLSATEQGNLYEADENDIAFIQFSSGSTGNPKGVVLSHKNLITNIYDISTAAAYSANDSTISWMPLTHDMGLIGFHLNPMFAGMHQYIISTADFVRNPALWMEKTSQHKITVLCSPNFGYKFLLKHCEDGQEYNWDLSHVRILYNGAEPISVSLALEFLRKFSKYGLKRSAMCPVYGLAEASLAVSISGLQDEMISINADRNKLNFGDRIALASEDGGVSFVNVGVAIEHCALRIADAGNIAVADGIIGHIQIKGDNVTRGYYNNEAATSKAITPDGWLDTGDLGFMHQHALYITGRAKDIIFVNGQNFYPHDIERVAEAVEGIELNKIAVAGFFNPDTQKEETIAFVFHRGTAETFVPVVRALRSFINTSVGFELDHIIPVTNIPRTTSGKLQRFRLLEQFREGQFNEVVAELSQLLETVPSHIAASILNDDERKLLRIWGHVLRTKHPDAERNFFEQGGNSLKAAELAMAAAKEFGVELPVEVIYEKQSLREMAVEIKNASQNKYTSIPKAPASDYYSITPSQEQLYYNWKLNPGSTAYNIPVAFTVDGSLNADRLEACIKKLVDRYDALRISFHADKPLMKVHETIDFKLEHGRPEVTLFDLTAAPLFRIKLFENILFTDFHHIISDGISVYNFISDLLSLYAGNEPSPLKINYTDYACWTNDGQHAGEEYWLQQLDGELPVLELPTDFKRPVLFNPEGKKLEFSIDAGTTKQLKQLAAANNVTLHVLMFTFYNILLSKYSSQEDIIVGIPVSGRRHPDLQGMFGMFVNNLAIRTAVKGTFEELLQKQKENVANALANQDHTFGHLVNKLAAKRDISRNPIFDTMFVYQNMGFPEAGALNLKRHFFDPGFSKFDISLEIFEEADSLKYYFEYCTHLFKEETILQFQRHFNNLVKDLSLLNEAERDEYIYSFNATSEDYPKGKTIHQLFEEQAERTPDVIALEWDNNTLTYSELNTKANALAADLKAKGIGRNTIVGVLLERSPELVISLLGILKAGGAYLPMDIDLPKERIASLIETSKCKFVIDKDYQITSATEIEDTAAPSDLAYVLYTSGTTGLPKGVMIEHRPVVNYITWAAKNYIRQLPAAFPLFTSISFDLTVTSIFTPLLTGGKIVIYKENGSDLLIDRIIAENKVDIIKLTPSHLKLLSEAPLHRSKVKAFIVGGENLETTVAQKIHDKFGGNIEIFNEYGPTEATVGCMIYKFNPADELAYVPIGIPAANTQIYILDKELEPVPASVIGEMYISGDGLARGYLFNEEMTQQKFIANPFIPGARMYKTGDMAKRLPGGQIIFLGRKDQQVKISGYRIELAEIENHLTTHPAVDEAVVTVRNGKFICAYYKLIEDVDAATLRHYLAQRLPHYMIPVHFVSIPEIPLNKNGKRDLTSLPDPVIVKENLLPRDQIEALSLEIWKQVLGQDQLSITDNFFELGGDSIKALQITSRLFEKGIALNVKDVLTYHTIEQISVHAKIVQNTHSQELCEGIKPVTPIESWFFAQQFEEPGYYNQSIRLQLNKKIDKQQLETAFTKLIRHHDGLRLNYNGQLFYNNNHLQQPFVITNEINGNFNLATDLLIRAAIMDDQLFIIAHHLIIDGISWRILLEDLRAAYNNQPLPQKTASLVQWQKALAETALTEKEVNYWKAS